ncbi:MAG TPA: DUF2171 domain-containing protein [Beijerinckiaceae bacterium]|jgi:hypothetical protein
MSIDPGAIQEHMAVLGSDGGPVGTVDKVEGRRLKLTRRDPEAGGAHHYLPLALVASVEGGTVRLARTAAQAREVWEAEAAGSEGRGVEPGAPTSGP